MHRLIPKIYLTSSKDPAVNLAIETHLIQNAKYNDIILLLWQNENTIVIGRNQNPYQECNLEEIRINNVSLVRRCSGGGAVYHDLGNLNFSFITGEENYDVNKQLQVIIECLKPFGLNAKYSGRNDIVIDGKKFSGNAFYSENDINCHHGTLLLDVDVQKMMRYLSVSAIKIDSKAIASVKSRVVNLSELNPDISIETIKKSLYNSFELVYGTVESIEELNISMDIIKDEVTKNRSWDWIYSQSPSYSITIAEKFDWAVIEFSYDVIDGKFKDCSFNTDALILENFNGLERKLIGKEVRTETINKAIKDTINNKSVRDDLISLFHKYIK